MSAIKRRAVVVVKSVLVRMPVDLLEAVDRRAAKRGISREAWIRGTLSAWTRVTNRRRGHGSYSRARSVLSVVDR